MPLFVVLILAIGVFGSVWAGYVLSVLWAWFVVPTFHLPQLSLVAAIGLAIIADYLTSHIDLNKPSEDTSGESWGKRFVEVIVGGVLKPLLALFFGWVVHLFM